MLPIPPSLIPYLVVLVLGAGMAWVVQGVRLDTARNETVKVRTEFKDYRVEQQRLKNEAEERERRRREESEHEWNIKYGQLRSDHDAFKRCVAAGKCGGLRAVPRPACGPGLRVPAAGRLDATGTDAVPAAGKPAAQEGEDEPQVIADCAKTTLMLNELQADIEKQMSTPASTP